MPLVPRRRHYSWPFSSPSTDTHDRGVVLDVRNSRQISPVKKRPRSHSPFLNSTLERSFHPKNLYEDDTFSADIIRSKSKRQTRPWLSPNSDPSEGHQRGRRGEKDVIISSITEADELPTAMLRRIIWPRLEKARQFLPMHVAAAATTVSGDKVIISCLSSPAFSGQRTEDAVIDEGHLRHPTGRRHRRCHSEQPRAWREPSPGLWTLQEE